MPHFSQFTQKYALSKTLRFELKPVGKTLDHLRTDQKYDPDLQTFLKDQDIEDAYQTLKPIFDKIHEDFITISLESQIAKNIDFRSYLEFYKNRGNEEKTLEKEEKSLREEIGKAYLEGEKWLKERSGLDEKWKELLGEKWYKCLTEAGILKYILKHTSDFLDLRTESEIVKSIDNETWVWRFFTYFSGFNQNRENYYTVDKEKSTAIATRIVHENLPKFCDNIILFESRKDEYLGVYNFLKSQNIITEIKERETGKMKEVYDITEDNFKIFHFPYCLSQTEITEYNRVIGHYNQIINSYNQAKRKQEKYTKLPLFKELFKQIGCGEKESFIKAITHDTEADIVKDKHTKDSISAESILRLSLQAWQKYFVAQEWDSIIPNTVPDFLDWLKWREDWQGIYWSKAAINSISNIYFQNWSSIKELIKDDKTLTSFDKNREEQIKINDAVELAGLFSILDKQENWKEEGIFFKANLTKPLDESEGNREENIKRKRRREIISTATSPSKALIALIADFVEENIARFLSQGDEILHIRGYKSDTWKEAIKSWMDKALSVNQALKYFRVKESKTKGETLNSELISILKNLLDAQDVKWFDWYDLLRNYLTKKPQDDAMENKLKLNFETSTLAGGWDVNKESANNCVILRSTEWTTFLAVMKKENNTLFQKEYIEWKWKNKIITKNPLYVIDWCDYFNKMEYDFWSDVSKMIPKCSTQLKDVIKHFRQSDEDFIFPIGYKVSSGEQFLEECRITKEQFELNNKVYKKEGDLIVSAFRYDLSETEEKKYIKSFQKGYLELLLKTGNLNNSEKEVCQKKYKDALSKWIDFCKYFIGKYPKTLLFEYTFSKTEQYESIDRFNLDVDISSYKLTIDRKINKNMLDTWVENGDIYLFEIRNQDLNSAKWENHKNNLHTDYWRAIFEQIENRPKLNGEAEIFYRKAISDEKLKKKLDKNGKEIIDGYRFAREKFVFHCPITLNFCLNDEKLNDIINTELSPKSDIYFLGLDRGEKHLVYYSIVDQDGKMIDQWSFNELWPEWKKVNYHSLLAEREWARMESRKNWQKIDNISKLKEGYISLVIHEIVEKLKIYPGFIVMEDLNTGFKRWRQKIEKSIYQKFELALAKKLNFVVDKSAKLGEIGSVTNALQLTPPVSNYGDIENQKQVGIMLYTRANYTSQTDPATGWRKTIYLKTWSEENIKEQIIGNGKSWKDEIKPAFTDFGFDGKDYYFKYSDKTGKSWTLYSGKNWISLDRFRGTRGIEKNEWRIENVDIAKMLDEIFINFDKNRSLLSQILDEWSEIKKPIMANGKEYSGTSWDALRFAIDLIQQIRNAGDPTRWEDDNFLLSPVRDENWNHFDTRKQQKWLPKDADANGAYNIARKWLIMNDHIKQWKKDGEKKHKQSSDLNLFISDSEWDLWLTNREEWKKQLPTFSSKKEMEIKNKKS
jgi:CRISPR-associated protein Cpf1